MEAQRNRLDDVCLEAGGTGKVHTPQIATLGCAASRMTSPAGAPEGLRLSSSASNAMKSQPCECSSLLVHSAVCTPCSSVLLWEQLSEMAESISRDFLVPLHSLDVHHSLTCSK